MRSVSTLLSVLVLSANFLHANEWEKTYSDAIYAGPEIYYVKRTKEGGAKQTGTLFGARIGYDHIKRYKLYWGAEALWAQGILNGKNDIIHLKSQLTDINVEARIGYTFQSKCWRCASFTPFIGAGYFWEKNYYKHPSPLAVHFDNEFSYIPVGFLSQIFLTPTFSLGLNAKIRFLLDGSQKVSHDPEHDNMTLHYDERLQYRIELPMTYFINWKCTTLAICLEPFYEFREYGHRANFPFDFFETKFQLIGATLKCFYVF